MKKLITILVLAATPFLAHTLMSEQPKVNSSEEPPCEDNACSLPSADGLAEEISSKIDANRSEAEWKKILTPEQYRVLRQHGTERPFKNEYWNNKKEGDYHCAGCGASLFESSAKYNSGTGWPSFYDAADISNIGKTVDKSHGMVRTEVHCAKCGGHLGHIFPDGPKPTGLRYCINSASLRFEEKGEN
ncbi:peptide-methionine (R)-S-oxide reductase MsrB [Puniceicoccaceae bacterium K14]|nr:peptide-methionine (R)-S-oxide reductase MsrB [Puniceicoccaceae bacterium K14]